MDTKRRDCHEKNFYLDLLLFISGLVCILTGVILDFHLLHYMGAGSGRTLKGLITNIHTYSGYIMMFGLIFHIIWHWKWVKAVAKKQLEK